MLYVKHEHGYENGRQTVEENEDNEIRWSIDDYQKHLKRELLTEPSFEGASAAERAEYSAGYMQGVEDALEAGAVDKLDCAHPDCPARGCVL
jgi:hypothetical protein